MNIAVLSPHSVNNGVTTVASFLALELGSRGKKTCLTHTSVKSPSMFKYFGLDDSEEDKTANPARMVKMLREGILKREEISEYCRPINATTEIYSANDATFNEQDMEFALNYIITTFPHDFVVFDVDIKDPDNERVKMVLGNCDFIIIVMEQNIKEASEFKSGMQKIAKFIKNKPMTIVVNNYESVIGKPGDLADAVGVKNIKKTSAWLTLRHNPYIIKYENNGNIQGLHRAMKTNDCRIIEIGSDVKNIANRIMKFRSAKRMGIQKKDEADTVENTETTSESTEK